MSSEFPEKRSLIARLLLSPYLLLGLTVLFWAGNAVVGKHAVSELTPMALSFCRWALALLIVLPFGWRHVRADWALIRSNWPIVLLLSGLGVAAFNTLQYHALAWTTVINVTMVSAVAPAVVPLFSWLLMRSTVDGRQVVGLVLSVIGALVVIAKGDLAILLELELNPGDLIAVLAVVDWALYSVLLAKRPKGLHPMSFLTITFALGLLLLMPLFAFDLWRTGGPVPGWDGQGSMLSSTAVMAIVFVALFPSIASYVFWNRGVAEVGANVAALFLNLIPVFSAVLAVLFLGEVFHGYHLIGMVLVGGGIVLVAFRPNFHRLSRHR